MRKLGKILVSISIAVVVLGSSPTNTYAALPYFPINFPRDHGGHQSNIPYEYPNGYWSEWWYFNGKLTSLRNKQFHYMVSIHQHMALMPDGSLEPMYLSNIQITDIENELSKSKQRVYLLPDTSIYISDTELDLSYGLFKFSDPSDNDAFTLRRDPETGKFKLKGRALVDGKFLKVNLTLVPELEEDDALMVNGTGFMEIPSVPGITSNMYYYSYPEMQTTGSFIFENKLYFVNPCKSESWMDHQWGDFTPTTYYSWDWFSLRLDNGLVGNIYINTQNPDKDALYGYASFILPDGTRVYETINSDFDWLKSNYWTAPNGMSYPMTHELNFNSIDLSVAIHSNIEDQFVTGLAADFWEGYSSANAVYNGQSISGYAYKELWYSDY